MVPPPTARGRTVARLNGGDYNQMRRRRAPPGRHGRGRRPTALRSARALTVRPISGELGGRLDRGAEDRRCRVAGLPAGVAAGRRGAGGLRGLAQALGPAGAARLRVRGRRRLGRAGALRAPRRGCALREHGAARRAWRRASALGCRLGPVAVRAVRPASGRRACRCGGAAGCAAARRGRLRGVRRSWSHHGVMRTSPCLQVMRRILLPARPTRGAPPSLIRKSEFRESLKPPCRSAYTITVCPRERGSGAPFLDFKKYSDYNCLTYV